MKRFALALLVAAAAIAASSARADTRVRIGVNIGGHHRPAPPAVVVAPPPAVVHVAPPAVVYAPPPAVVHVAPRGYWKEVHVKTWVPERWSVRHNRWGHAERHCEPGYYTYTTQRVWVDGSHGHHEHPGRGHAYGHNHDRGHSYGRGDDDHNRRGPDRREGWRR